MAPMTRRFVDADSCPIPEMADYYAKKSEAGLIITEGTLISKITIEYSNAAKNAMKAGFNGIEIHAANGYLVDQFLHHCTNIRNDIYGVSSENMSRFCLDIVKSCMNEIGNDKIGLRISPGGHMAEIQTNSKFLLKKILELNIAYVHIGNFDDSIIYPELDNKTMTKFVRDIYSGNLVACRGYDIASAHEGILSNQFDLVTFGRSFISNPDYIYKIKSGKEIIRYDIGILGSLN
jgi:N-ethylmaleimide reductase